MSRCFPFPPPGYEKNSRNDNVESLAKEKHRDKNHKEKKDKGKRDGKERRDKERSNDKHKEKKEKHKHKKKDKDKHKEKSYTVDGNETVKESSGYQIEGKLAQSGFQSVDHKETILKEELGRRMKNEARPSENHLHQENSISIQRLSDNNQRGAQDYLATKFMVDLGQQIKKETRLAGNQVFSEAINPVQIRAESTLNVLDQRRAENLARALGKEDKGTPQKEKKQGGDPNREKWDGSIATTAESGISSIEQSFGIGRGEGKEKNKDKKSKEGSDKKRDGKEKRNKKKDKKREKGKEDRCENIHEEKLILTDRQMEQMDSVNTKAPFHPMNSGNKDSIGSEGNLKKRKGFETNGFIHEQDLHPAKLPRVATSSKLPLDSGKNCQPPNITVKRIAEKQGATNDIKGPNKEQKLCDSIQVLQSKAIPQPTVPSEESLVVNCSAAKKRPHPDSVHLTQLLSIPKAAQLPAFDDQDWLFSSSGKLKSTNVANETAQIWEKSLRIDSADVIALPYVVPY